MLSATVSISVINHCLLSKQNFTNYRPLDKKKLHTTPSVRRMNLRNGGSSLRWPRPRDSTSYRLRELNFSNSLNTLSIYLDVPLGWCRKETQLRHSDSSLGTVNFSRADAKNFTKTLTSFEWLFHDKRIAVCMWATSFR